LAWAPVPCHGDECGRRPRQKSRGGHEPEMLAPVCRARNSQCCEGKTLRDFQGGPKFCNSIRRWRYPSSAAPRGRKTGPWNMKSKAASSFSAGIARRQGTLGQIGRQRVCGCADGSASTSIAANRSTPQQFRPRLREISPRVALESWICPRKRQAAGVVRGPDGNGTVAVMRRSQTGSQEIIHCTMAFGNAGGFPLGENRVA